MIIYKVTNKINGKIYIGQTIRSMHRRRIEHMCDSTSKGMYFHNAIKKYGAHSFKWKIIHTCSNINDLNRLEAFYIGFYDTLKNGYNLKAGGDNSFCSEETKRKMSEAQSGEKGHMWDKHHSPETKKKMSNSHKGEKHYLFGKHPTKEALKNMSNSHKGKRLSEATKKKMSESRSGSKSCMWGKHPTEETKKKMSEAKLGKRPINVISVIIEGKCFYSQTEAAISMGVSRETIKNRIQHRIKWQDYNYA